MSIGTKLKAIREYNGHCQKEIADRKLENLDLGVVNDVLYE